MDLVLDPSSMLDDLIAASDQTAQPLGLGIGCPHLRQKAGGAEGRQNVDLVRFDMRMGDRLDLQRGVRSILKLLVDTFTGLEAQITVLDAEINPRSKTDPAACRLMTVPGVGPIVSTAITALAPAAHSFAAGRDFAAWLGLTPLQRSIGGKQKLGAVTKRDSLAAPRS